MDISHAMKMVKTIRIAPSADLGLAIQFHDGEHSRICVFECDLEHQRELLYTLAATCMATLLRWDGDGAWPKFLLSVFSVDLKLPAPNSEHEEAAREVARRMAIAKQSQADQTKEAT